MKFLPLVWRNLMRRKIRTFMTVMSIVVAFGMIAPLGDCAQWQDRCRDGDA